MRSIVSVFVAWVNPSHSGSNVLTSMMLRMLSKHRVHNYGYVCVILLLRRRLRCAAPPRAEKDQMYEIGCTMDVGVALYTVGVAVSGINVDECPG